MNDMTDHEFHAQKVQHACDAMDDANYKLTLAHIALLTFKADDIEVLELDQQPNDLVSELADRRDEFVVAYNAHNALLR